MQISLKRILETINPGYRALCRLERSVARIERTVKYSYLRQYHNRNTLHSRSQDGQDVFVESVLGGKRDGVFIELGAADGLTISNTYYLERVLGWTGILIEANPTNYQSLVKNRANCCCLQACIADTVRSVDYVDRGALSGIKDQLSEQYGEELASAPTIAMQTEPLQGILDRQRVHRVDYLSLDTEGSELAVLRSIDFGKTHITLIGVEINSRDYQRSHPAIGSLLYTHGYREIEQVGSDYFFYRE